jgi:hypothetical protein
LQAATRRLAKRVSAITWLRCRSRKKKAANKLQECIFNHDVQH